MNRVQEMKPVQVAVHPSHSRLRTVIFDDRVIAQFLEAFRQVNAQELEYVPYARFVLAAKLMELVGPELANTLASIVHDRDSGGFLIGLQGQSDSEDDYVKFATAITHLIGIPNFDSMSGTYYARFAVKDTDSSDSYLRQAYRMFTLHTDGTFVDEPTDWLMMMKMKETNAIGGESRLLHLDDWEELDRFTTHPLAANKVTYKAPPSKNVQQIVHRSTFYKRNDKPCICFIDQFANPETIEQAVYFHDLSRSLEASPAVLELELPVGSLVVLNNHFWMHGRAPFQKHSELYRELMRLRGVFSGAM